MYIGKLVEDADTMLRHLSGQPKAAEAVASLKKQLKNFSKNELVRLGASLLIANDMLKGELDAKNNPPAVEQPGTVNPDGDSTSSSADERAVAPEQQEHGSPQG